MTGGNLLTLTSGGLIPIGNTHGGLHLKALGNIGSITIIVGNTMAESGIGVHSGDTHGVGNRGMVGGDASALSMGGSAPGVEGE